MQSTNAPSKLVLPFANSGGKNAIPVDSQVGITPGAASLQDGFPPLTRTPIAAGGVPPSGLDMNGILYEMSAVLRWLNAGGGFTYDSTFAADPNVGGYPKGARLLRADGAGFWLNTQDNNSTDPESAGAAAAGWIPDLAVGAAVIPMASANVTLTPAQYGKQVIVITGALTANLNLIFPDLGGMWVVANKTTGGFTVTCKTAAGVGVAVQQNTNALVAGVSPNIVRVGGKAPVKRVITATGPYNKPEGLAYLEVAAQAAGGGGGASRTTTVSAQTSAGSGGGSGAWVSGIIPAANVAATETVTIGAAGLGGTGEGGGGTAGGASSFGAHLTATGGEGGLGGNTPTVETNRGAALGGATGTATAAPYVLNLIVNRGRRGGIATRFATGAVIGATGGASQMSAGGGPNAEGSGGQPADGYGGGGAGASSGGTGSDGARAGGNGSPGVIEIWEFYE